MAQTSRPRKQQAPPIPQVNDGQTNKPSRSFSARTLAMVLAMVSLLVYANTLRNGYALDDFSCITKNTIVTKGVSAIPQLLSTPYHYGFHPSDNDLYRPLSLIMFAVEYQLVGENATLGHLLNILLFAACVVLLFFFLLRILGTSGTAVAFFSSLLFAVHPIHTEIVANIKGRDELLCFFFAFLSLLTFIRYAIAGTWHILLAGNLCFFLSLLAKETSITFLAIFPLVFFCYIDTNKKRSTIITGSAIVVAGIYLALRFSVLHAYHADLTTTIPFEDNALVSLPSTASRFATAVLLLGMYIKLLFVPWPLVCDYSFNSIPYAGFGHWGFLLSLTAYVLIAVLGLYQLVQNRKDPLAFAALFFLITISLFSNIFFLLGATMGERFLFFASVGFCLAMALLLAKWLKRYQAVGNAMLGNFKAWAVVLPVTGVFAYLSISRNSEWADNYTLYSADVQKAPDNMRLHWFRGNELTGNTFMAQTSQDMKLQAMTEGVRELQQALAIYPDMLPAHQDLGHAFFMMRQYDSSMLHSRKVLERDPANAIALFNISGVFFSTEKYDSSIAYCQKARASDPGNYDIPRNIAFSYLQMKQYDSSIHYFKTVLSKYPDDGFCANYIAVAFESTGQIDSARKYHAVASQVR